MDMVGHSNASKRSKTSQSWCHCRVRTISIRLNVTASRLRPRSISDTTSGSMRSRHSRWASSTARGVAP